MNSSRHPCVDLPDAPRLRPLSALVLSSLAVWSTNSHAETPAPIQIAQTDFAQVEFDPGFLSNGAAQDVDLSRFQRGNVVAPGDYSVDIHVGDTWIGRHEVPFKATPGTPDAHPCFDKPLLTRIGVDFGKLPAERLAQLDAPGACLRIGQVVPEASATFDFAEQRLSLSIPQASLVHRARGYVNPDQWSSGVAVGMLGYNLNLYSTKPSGSRTLTTGYLGVDGGVNLGNWHFRHSGSYSWSSQGASQYQNIATYLQRDLPSLASQLYVGEYYTPGDLFDSTQFRGVRLSTDDRMLPDSLRGYAPTVRGIANSNAKVSIRQNGVLLYETNVAPGPFEINDLYPTGYGGDLQVSVTEADGSINSFAVPYAAVATSLRPGTNRYSFVAGTVRNQQSSSNPLFTQATWQRGLTNLVTGYGGVTFAQGYVSAMLGAAFNTPLGAIGVDVTQASTSIPGVKRFNGSTFRINYSKSIEPTSTNITLAAYRYSTGGYFNLNDAMLTRDMVRNGGSVNDVWRERNRASLALSQSLGAKGGQLGVTVSASNYWNRPGSNVSYSASYSNSFRNIMYNLSATRQRSQGGAMSTLYYASVSIPLGKTRPVTLSGNVSHDTRGNTQLSSTLSGSLGVDNDLSYNVRVNHASGAGSSATTGDTNVTYRGRLAEVSAGIGGGADYQQGSLGIRGAAVAHRGGITLSQPLSETFGIIEAPDAAGARVTNTSGVRVDGRGYAIVPYLTPYNMNTVELDPKGLSLDVELRETSLQVAPRAGAVPLLRFATVSGRALMIKAHQPDGAPLPFGSAVLDESGKDIGVVGQASKIFVRGLKDKGELTVKWGDSGQSSCRITYDLPVKPAKQKASVYQQITATCAPDALTAATQPDATPSATR